MDSLFDSINVRDLLSTHDLSDPTSPLSAPDLRLLIQRLESHSLQIKSKVQSYLLAHHQDFSNLFSLCNDAVSQSHQISGDVSNILKLISDRPIDVEIREIVEEMKGKREELKVKRELLVLVRAIVEMNQRLKDVKEGLRNGRLKFAAEEVRDLKMALRVSDDNGVDDREPVVYGLLRKEWSQCFEEIQELLVRILQNAIRFDGEANRVQVKYRSSFDVFDEVELQTVLEAMEVVGILDYGIAKVADLMIKYVITPFISRGSRLSVVEEINQVSEAILKISPTLDRKSEDLDGEGLYSGILQLIKFIYRSICFQNASWIRCFGRLTWPRISDLIISNYLSKVVPEDASKISEFQKTIKCTIEFETSLKEFMFISASDNYDNRLSNFAENVEVHFASKKKTEILAKARNLILQCDFAIPQDYTREGPSWKNAEMATQSSKHVVDLLFLSERCLVSEAANQLMELVHQTLKDVCLSSKRVALEFYRAARDAIILYEAVVPVKLERQLDTINQVAVLMHNDCLYLSQEILGLAFEYRTDFPDSIKEHTVFVDLAPRFHLMAEEILQRQVHLVVYNLNEAIDSAEGFQNTHEKPGFELARFSMDQVVFILEKVHIIWEPLLLPSTYKRSMCRVLESVFSRIVKDILLLDDIAEDETLQLQRMIHLMLDNLSSLLESLVAVNKKSQEMSTPSPDELIPSLRKIRKLSEILDMPLKSITTAWETKELVACGFTMSEVQDFLKAIFTDSPLRRECIWRIESTGF
ncbi:Centromere/kinetochore protein zw10 like [Quillaja saponaria]|uniref:Centromere/kinetochore protein zw10 like n=1 Tax=Quillaja saponaria TaxID=32244 RepID=A0AAD7LUU9_QUISA|nr:Centromere/kinetochore protein zw10 like [Quillaja saponaria]